MKNILLISVFLLLYSAVFSQQVIGNWQGNMEVNGQQIPVIFHFDKDSSAQIKGTWDSPKQKAFGLPISTITIETDSVFLSIKMIGGSYKGKFIGNDSIAGMWYQGGGKILLNFSRFTENINTLKTNFLPNEKEIGIISSGVKLYGTLFSKNNDQKLAIVIAGSGPTDRDGNNPLGVDANSYKMLAQSLDSENIATFRYDKRGVGKSISFNQKEDQLVFEDYIKDAQRIFNFLHDTLGYINIYIIGHSEGSLIGMVAAQKKNKVRGFISLAGSGRPIDKVIKEQVKKQLPDSIQKEVTHILNELKKGKQVDQISDPLLPIFRRSAQPYMMSWLKYSPATEIKKVNSYVLIIQGTCDKQVNVKDAEFLHAANKKSRLQVIPLMTHTLKNTDENCNDKNNITYTDSSLPLNIKLVNDIVAFIKKH